jgi:hypothetical protein
MFRSCSNSSRTFKSKAETIIHALKLVSRQFYDVLACIAYMGFWAPPFRFSVTVSAKIWFNLQIPRLAFLTPCFFESLFRAQCGNELRGKSLFRKWHRVRWYKFTHVSEEHISYIFRVEEYVKQTKDPVSCFWACFYPEDESSTLLRMSQ